ncbi:unnamed protein product [Staurois parvus]|uniref:Uncharacterized protein n=1 Tax=Staurois parvus TaxID=386267 RepID=A0ABN9DU05_9NEOB|nr:unnamed protein product [Staurois parvus]
MYTDNQCALMVSVAPEVPSCQCPSVPAVSAHQCLVPVPISATSMPHISAHLSCLSISPISAMSPISASQCHLSVPVSATYQCQSVLPNSASQCRLSVPCPSVMPVSAHQCHLSVPITTAH